MRNILIFAAIALIAANAFAQTPKKVTAAKITGELLRYEKFPSVNVDPRNVDVWLPPGYGNDRRKYPVLYMHDGQMLFDEDSTWNKQEWGMDETMTRLIGEGKIRPAIIVGIWNTEKRREEYMPQKAIETATDEQKKDAGAAMDVNNLVSDKYLKFLVAELKPFIDRNYRTLKGRGDTFVMGSSMGGLISLYAISEYPKVFGGAGCVSTHWPAGKGAMIGYMKKYLPAPRGHKIYFDFGTLTLDAAYEPYQILADEVMQQKGYTRGVNWLTRKFPGDFHAEVSWRKRIDIPLIFLLGKN